MFSRALARAEEKAEEKAESWRRQDSRHGTDHGTCRGIGTVPCNTFDAALKDVSASLTAMDLAVRAFAPGRPMRIFGKVTAYRTANQRTSAFNVWKERDLLKLTGPGMAG